jgi:hypothetical protein
MAPEVCDQAFRFFDHICSCKTKDEFNDGMDKLQLLFPSLTDYLRYEVYEFRSLSTETFSGKSLTLDYYATSLAESANVIAMKRNNRGFTGEFKKSVT